MKEKVFPVRKCVGCNQMIPKNQLFRVVKNADGNIFIDIKGNADGRGAYVCQTRECVDLAVKKKGFNRSLKCPVDAQVIDELYKNIENVRI